MVIDVSSNRLDARFLTTNGVSRDHFTLLKGTPPVPPIDLVATLVDTTQIALSWEDSATDRTAFAIERSMDGTNFTRILSTASNVTTVVNTGLLEGVTYFYRVRAANFASESDPSEIASATTVTAGGTPVPPGNLTASPDNGIEAYRSQMVLRWRDRSANEAGFIVERSTDGDSFAQIASVGANVTHFIDRRLQSAKVYYYRVRSFNSEGSSPASNLAGDQTHPQNNVALVGSTVTFHGGVEGVAPVRYQWRFEGAPISGATNESFALLNIQSTSEGNYSVEVTDATGKVLSNPAYLFVVAAPYVLTDPSSSTNLPGSSVVLTVDVVGDEPLTYRWRRNGVTIPTGTASALLLESLKRSNEGSYDVVVQNDFGSVTSRVATLVVNAPPLATVDSLYRLPDQGFVFDVSALLANDTDTDGDALTFTGLSATSSHGASLAVNGSMVTYTPAASYNGPDTFSYTVSDSRGAIGSAVVTVYVVGNSMQIVSVQALPANRVALGLNALANQSCTLLFAPTLGAPWTTVTNYPAVPTNRVIQVSLPQAGPSGFYRLQSP